jgi:hypothetical protein
VVGVGRLFGAGRFVVVEVRGPMGVGRLNPVVVVAAWGVAMASGEVVEDLVAEEFEAGAAVAAVFEELEMG